MTEAELRKHFKLKPCPNPSHPFTIGSLMGEWIWAEDFWAQLVGEHMQTLHFCFSTTENQNGTKLYSIVIWKLKVIWSFIK
jgi:hypothetical protein